jgi:hypothetical protein
MHSDAGDATRLAPGYPIRTPWDHRSVDNSPRTIAASHVLHRPLVPRHPPSALTNLPTYHDEQHTPQQHQQTPTTTTTRCSRPLCKSQPTTNPPPHHHPRRRRGRAWPRNNTPPTHRHGTHRPGTGCSLRTPTGCPPRRPHPHRRPRSPPPPTGTAVLEAPAPGPDDAHQCLHPRTTPPRPHHRGHGMPHGPRTQLLRQRVSLERR